MFYSLNDRFDCSTKDFSSIKNNVFNSSSHTNSKLISNRTQGKK